MKTKKKNKYYSIPEMYIKVMLYSGYRKAYNPQYLDWIKQYEIT